MATAVPFSTLLDVLRTRGLAIGLTDYRDLALLLSRYDGSRPEELRTAIAALLARDRIERSLIADCFDQLFVPGRSQPIESQPEDVSTAPEPTPVRRSLWQRIVDRPYVNGIAAASLLLAAILAGPIARAWRSAVDLPPIPDAPPVWTQPPSGPLMRPDPPAIPRAPEDPPPVLRPRWSTLFVPGAIALVATLGLRAGRRSILRRWSQLRSARQSQAASIAGPRFYRWRVDRRVGAIPRAVVEEIATMLARRHEVVRTGTHLDVGLTIRRTLDAGLFPRLVYQPPCRTLPLLVLRDVSPEMRPWTHRIDCLLEDLGRLGVPMWCWSFDVSASYVWRSINDPGMPLATLARTVDDAALMVISTGAGLQAARVDAPEGSWIRLLEKWPARTWVTPLTSRAHWRRELADVPMNVWPMTPNGLTAAARDLLFDATHRPTAPLDALAGARRVGADDLERVKRLVALVPPPTPVRVVEALRARFTPDVPVDVVLPLLALNESLDTSAVRLPEAERSRLIESLRRDNPDREAEVRRFLLGLLEASEPPADSVAHMRWETDRAIHRAAIATLSGEDTARELAPLAALAEGPLADEVRARAAGAGAARLPLPRDRPATGAGRPPAILSRLTAADAGVAALAAAVAVLAFVAISGVDRTRLDHRHDVWTLAWDASRQSLVAAAAASNAPARNITLVRDGNPLATVSSIGQDGNTIVRDRVVDRGEAGAWYQLRAPIGQGRLALSNSTWVPGPAKSAVFIATFKSETGGTLPEVTYTLRGEAGGSINGRANEPVDAQPGLWWLSTSPPGYKPLYEQPVTIGSDRANRQEFKLTATAAPVLAVFQLDLRDVYGDAARPPLDVEFFFQDGRPIAKRSVPDTSNRQSQAGLSYMVDWKAIAGGYAPDAIDVRVASPLYQPAKFAMSVKPGVPSVVLRQLLYDPQRVRPRFESAAAKEIEARLYEMTGGKPLSDEAHANALNVFTVARTITVTLERPMGTFSRNLPALLSRIENVTATNVDASVASDVAAYLETWMRLQSRVTNRPNNRAQQSPVQQNQARVPVTQQLDIPTTRGAATLHLAFENSRAGGRLTMTLRPMSTADAHPYLVHQLLVREGYQPRMFRLEPFQPASAK